MTGTPAKALAIARPVILILIIVNLVSAAVVAGLLVWSFFIEGWPVRPLGIEMTSKHPWVGDGLRAIVALGVVSFAIAHTILRRLLAIVDTVRVGDPFVLDNSRRLESIAWRVLALEGLRFVIATIAALVWQQGRVAAFSLTPWLAVLLLFVLAGVFSHGARMRADLEGTV